MSDAQEATKGGSEKVRSKHRSPNYPLFDLGKAVEQVKKLYDADKTHKVPIGVVHERWSHKKHSGAGNQAVAAAKSYGLITVEGNGDQRLVAVSDVGRRIVLNASDRAELLKKAAVGPSLFNSLWEKYQETGLPSDDVLSHHLIFDRDFNEDVITRVIDRFKATVVYAGLVAGDKIDGVEGDKEEAGDAESGNGENRDGSASRTLKTPLQPKRRQMTTGFKEDVFSLDEGSVVLQWPERLSKSSAEDLNDWLELIGRKIKRAVDSPPEPEGDEEPDNDLSDS